MKTRITTVSFIFILSFICLNGQTTTVKYAYDDNGNRINRTLDVEGGKSGDVQFPVRNPDQFPKEDQKPEDGELSTFIYPNPNEGLLKIEILNMPQNSTAEARIYDLNGIELIVKKNIESYYEMDINSLKDGIYILRIRINEIIFNWKVIKKQ